MKTANRELTFLNGTYLKVEGPEPPFTTTPPPDSVHQKRTVTLQCSVLHDFQNKTCPDDNVFCLSVEPHQPHPGSNYTHVNGGDEYERNSEALSTKTCFYSYFRNLSSSDSQTYSCAVATCVESFSGDKTKGDTDAVNKTNSVKDYALLYLLCVALAVTLIVIASLIYSVKKNSSCVGCNGMQSQSYINLPNNIQQNWTDISVVDLFINTDAVALRTNVTAKGDQEILQVVMKKKKNSSSFLMF
uniref:Ig-like domain-containing protein n=1 Tax=Oreochromis niloticus TaxID=8128 RepID=A0A669C811_ORENI